MDWLVINWNVIKYHNLGSLDSFLTIKNDLNDNLLSFTFWHLFSLEFPCQSQNKNKWIDIATLPRIDCKSLCWSVSQSVSWLACPVFASWAAALKGIKACRIQGDFPLVRLFIRLFIRLSPPGPRPGPNLTQGGLIQAQGGLIHALWCLILALAGLDLGGLS